MTSAAIPTLPAIPAIRPNTRLATEGWVPVFFVMMVVAALLRVVAMFSVPLVPEEAYYWSYSQHPNLSYFDHPPMVAWVIGAGTALFGNTEFGVRFFVHLMSLGMSLLLYHYGRMWFSRAAGAFAALAVQALPMYFGVGYIATMDSALLFFWIACLVSLSHVLLRGRTWCWYPAGLALGGALLTKYTGVFLVAGTGLALLIHRPWRRQFLTVHPYLAILLGFAVFSPVVIWNAQHDWASFRFQFLDRFDAKPIQLKTIVQFLLIQLMILTPVLLIDSGKLVGRTVTSWRRLKRPRWLLPVCFGVPLFAVMAQKSLRYGIHLNWTLPAFLAMLPAMAHLTLMRARVPQRAGQRHKSVLRPIAVTAIVCAAVNIGLMTYLLTLQHRMQWINAFGRWPELASIVDEHADALRTETGRDPLIIGSGKYRLASIIGFYRDAGASTRNTTSQWRVGLGSGLAYPFWADAARWRGADCVIVIDRTDPAVFEVVRPLFDRLDVIDDPRLHQLKGGYSIAIGRGLHDLPESFNPSRDSGDD